MNLSTLNKACHLLEPAIRANFQHYGELLPVTFYLIPRADTGHDLFTQLWADFGTDKQRIRAGQQQWLRELGATAIAFAVESWCADVLDDEQPLMPARGQPNRYEAIILRGECPDGLVYCTIRIDRFEGKPPVLGESDWQEADRADALIEGEVGLFAGYFPAPRGQA